MKFETPEYSQFLDVEDKEWQGKSCGILSLKMLIDYWKGANKVSNEDVGALIEEGLSINAYIPEVGWRHRELVDIATMHGLDGESFDWIDEHPDVAFNKLIPHLTKHPVMISIHKNLEEGNSGHLAVLTGYENGEVMYNDPDSKTRDEIQKSVPLQEFLDGWKRRIVVIHPVNCDCNT